MKNEYGNEMTEKDIQMESMNLISDVCCLLFESKDDKIIAAAYMADLMPLWKR